MNTFFSLNKYLPIVILLLGGFNFSSFAQEHKDEIKNLSKGADIILTGKVIQQSSSWNDDRTKIYTDVTIEADEYLKGSNNNRIIVTHPGGEVGEVGELYSHMPSFKNNEEVLLFLRKDKQRTGYKVLNGEDGKLTLYKDKTTGEKVTSSNEKISTLKKEIKKYIENRQ